MSAEAALAAGRRAARTLMTDTVQIRRVVGLSVDPMTGEDSPEYVTVYEGPAKLQSYEGYEQSKEVVEHSATIQRMTLHIPVGAYKSAVGDVVVFTGSRDELLAGREFRVTQEAPFKTHATAYRIFVDFKAE